MLPGNGNKLQTETEPASARIGSVGYNLNSCRIFHYYLGVFCVRNVMQNINYGSMAMATNAQVEIAVGSGSAGRERIVACLFVLLCNFRRGL